jgi:hypothetical protein
MSTRDKRLAFTVYRPTMRGEGNAGVERYTPQRILTRRHSRRVQKYYLGRLRIALTSRHGHVGLVGDDAVRDVGTMAEEGKERQMIPKRQSQNYTQYVPKPAERAKTLDASRSDGLY